MLSLSTHCIFVECARLIAVVSMKILILSITFISIFLNIYQFHSPSNTFFKSNYKIVTEELHHTNSLLDEYLNNNESIDPISIILTTNSISLSGNHHTNLLKNHSNLSKNEIKSLTYGIQVISKHAKKLNNLSLERYSNEWHEYNIQKK